MKSLLITLFAALSLPSVIYAENVPNTHEYCKDAKDYLGCIKSQKVKGARTAIKKQYIDMMLYGKLYMTCFANSKKYITQAQQFDMVDLALYVHARAYEENTTQKEDAKKIIARLNRTFPNCFSDLKKIN